MSSPLISNPFNLHTENLHDFMIKWLPAMYKNISLYHFLADHLLDSKHAVLSDYVLMKGKFYKLQSIHSDTRENTLTLSLQFISLIQGTVIMHLVWSNHQGYCCQCFAWNISLFIYNQKEKGARNSLLVFWLPSLWLLLLQLQGMGIFTPLKSSLTDQIAYFKLSHCIVHII